MFVPMRDYQKQYRKKNVFLFGNFGSFASEMIFLSRFAGD